jgi:hypothetical protein
MLLLLPSAWSSLALIIKGHCNCCNIGILQLQPIKHVCAFASEAAGSPYSWSCDRLSVGECVLVSGCHLELMTRFFFSVWQLWVSWCWAPSLTRAWVCNLLVQLLLGLARAVTLGSKSCRTHDHVLLSHLRPPQHGGPGPRIYITRNMPTGTGFPFRRLLRLAGLRWRYSNPPPHGLNVIIQMWNSLNNCLRGIYAGRLSRGRARSYTDFHSLQPWQVIMLVLRQKWYSRIPNAPASSPNPTLVLNWICSASHYVGSMADQTLTNSVALVRERTIPI